jgi:hypothetical protein
MQNYARRQTLAIDTLAFDFNFRDELAHSVDAKPDVGAYVHGLFLEAPGATAHACAVLHLTRRCPGRSMGQTPQGP